jgi:hypothetical protein
MDRLYLAGCDTAFEELGVKEASLRTVLVRQRKDPLSEIHRRIAQLFKVKTPKFDVTAQLARLLNNPFKQPTAMLSGKLQPLKV